jgi:hypothetical protein
MVSAYFSFELCVKSLRALREPFNHGEHKGFFTEGAKRSGKFLTAEDAEDTELDGEEWFSANDKLLFFCELCVNLFY